MEVDLPGGGFTVRNALAGHDAFGSVERAAHAACGRIKDCIVCEDDLRAQYARKQCEHNSFVEHFHDFSTRAVESIFSR